MLESKPTNQERRATVRALYRLFGRRPLMAIGNRHLYHAHTELPAFIGEPLATAPRAFRQKLISTFTCYLDVIGTPLALPSPSDNSAIWQLIEGFVGAYHCDEFAQLSPQSRYTWTRALRKCFSDVSSLKPLFEELAPSGLGTSMRISHIANVFRSTPLLRDEAEYWAAWPARNATNTNVWLPLAPLYRKFGREWTHQLYAAISNWQIGRRSKRAVPGLAEFCVFLSTSRYSASELKSSAIMYKVWHEFWSYFSTHRARTSSSKTIILEWRAHWVDFVKSVLEPSMLFGRCYDDIPGPGRIAASSVSVSVGIRPDSDSDCALLVTVPASVSDRLAIDNLLKAIPECLNIIKRWAEVECADMMRRYLRRRRLRAQGTPRLFPAPLHVGEERWKRNRDNPDYLKNASATLHRYGFQSSDDARLNALFPVPLASTAHELALPAGGTLVPFAARLVAIHPEITPGFLEDLTIWSQNGKLTGLYRVKGVVYLQGVKFRKREKAAQRIPLTRESLRIILCLLLVTREVRDYLRKRNSLDWRYLFLTTGKGFGSPQRVKRFSSDTSRRSRIVEMSASLQRIPGVSSESAQELAERFSLRTLRTTVALGHALSKWSEDELATSLGHERTSPTLLSRYVPESLANYFRARWVRAFQNCLILFATRDSPYRLRATGFDSYQEMEAFLDTNDLPDLERLLSPSFAEATQGTTEDGTFYAISSPEALYCWAALGRRNTQRKSLGQPATAYGELGERLIAHLITRRGYDPAVDQVLDDALSRAEQIEWTL